MQRLLACDLAAGRSGSPYMIPGPRYPRCVALVAVLMAVTACSAQTPAPPRPAIDPASRLTGQLESAPAMTGLGLNAARPVYEDGPVSEDGTGRYFLGREIARVMSHRGAAWLERADREREERPALLLSSLGIKADDVVADLGAGTGYFTFRIAPMVPQGRVLAVDIQPEMLSIIESRAAEEGFANVAPVMGFETSPGLRPSSVDLTLIVDAYHEFSHPFEMLQALFASTKPGGRIAVVEYRAEDPAVPIRRLHKLSEAQARSEIESVGFRFVENINVLPQQHILVFERARE